MKPFDPAKVLFYTVSLMALVGGAFVLGVHAGSEQNAAYRFIQGVETSVTSSLVTTATELPTLTGLAPTHFLQPSRHRGAGVTVNDLGTDQRDLILLAGFFDHGNELRLIRRNGEVVTRWPVSFRKLFPNPEAFIPKEQIPATDWNVDTHGALALPDGSIVFNFEWSGLVKLDRCGQVVWTVPRRTHHSVERADDDTFWVGERRLVGSNPLPPFDPPYEEDAVLNVSADGRILAEHSVPQLFYDNGLAAVLTAGQPLHNGAPWDRELVHLNKVAALPRAMANDFPMFAPGDLLLSLRNRNLLAVVEPGTWRIKWWHLGPYLRQHDPEFVRGGQIVVFNNNIYRSAAAGPIDWLITPVTTPRISNLMQINPGTNAASVVYGMREDQELLSIVRGKIDPTPRHGFLVTEFDGGRAFEIDQSKRIVWEYINRYSPQAVAEITEARLYPASYFTAQDWSCPAHK